MDRIAKALERARTEGDIASVEPLRIRDAARPLVPGEIRYSQTRPVAVSPDVLRARHVSIGDERTAVAEAFKQLRTQVLQRLRERGHNTLGVASARAGAGKTTVALNLAIHTAKEADWTSLLVDTDLRHPGLCDALGIAPLPGLSDHLTEDQPLEKLLINPGFGHCILLPAGRPIGESSEALGSARMHDLAEELKRRYPDRLVVFDLPPLLDSADGIAALPWIESLLLVVEEAESKSEDVQRAAALAGESRLIGTVMNKSVVATVSDPRQPWWRRLFGTA
jgi:Mrp family chromosome partitioning ATPase